MRPAAHRWAIIAAAAVCVLMPSRAMPQDSTGVVARVASVTGAATIYTAVAGAAYTAAGGFILNPGDRVDTRGGGRVTIELSDGSMIVVEPQSTVTLKDYRQASSLRELFEIALGKVRVKINHFGGRPNPYRMNSPTASIAVRGTEFSITVTSTGDTEVVVYEGAVEVTTLADPSQSVFVEAGRAVLVQGRDFHMIAAAGLNGRGPGGEREHHDLPGGADQRAGFAPANALGGGGSGHGDRDAATPRATASAYDSYVAGLSDIAQMPFLFRFNAFPEAHLDSLENPAYATQFTRPEGRIFLLPTFGGGSDLDDTQRGFGPVGSLPQSYSVSPQVSMFGRLGDSNYFGGGSFSSSRAVSSAAMGALDEGGGKSPTAGSSTASFYSGSLVAARRFDRLSAGAEVETMRGTGSLSSTTIDNDGHASVESILAASRISQTRLTAGASYDFGGAAKLGVFYRYGFITARDHDLSHTVDGAPAALNLTDTMGHSSEIGFRLRGAIRSNLFYGVTGAWLGVALGDALARATAVDSNERDRARRTSLGFGLGYAVTRRTVLTFDVAGGLARASSTRLESATGNLLQTSGLDGRFVSTHAAVQTDLSQRLFVSASYLNIWRRERLNLALFPDRFGATSLVQDSFFPMFPNAYQLASHFSDFGVGWRFSPSFFVQYLFSTDYGVTGPSHALMLRYTFRLRRGE